MHGTKGFTLLEMSIVIVIIGLLAGAVIGGRAMIRTSELQSIITDFEKYRDATNLFKTQYHEIPGDMIDGTDFWGTSTACGGTSATGVCNGNGDGVLSYATTNGGPAEAYQFWRELALSGRISGNYSGLSGPVYTMQSLPGFNVPTARMTDTGWEAGSSQYLGTGWLGVGADPVSVLDYGNYFRFGLPYGGIGLAHATLKPAEAWKIDTKMDDGLPARGSIIAANPDSSSIACTSATSTTDLDSPYDLEVALPACTLFFIKQF